MSYTVGAVHQVQGQSPKGMMILVHFPTRGRRQQASETLAGYESNADHPDQITYSIACNSPSDVPLMSAATPMVILHDFPSKIAAYNAIPTNIEWDIVLGASDDMWCQQKGWDTIIREAMQNNFPDTDGCLWFSDGRQDRFTHPHPNGTPICTMSIMGRAAYEREGYLYHPDYKSFFCDNEWTDVWNERGKLYADPRCLFRNEHYAWGGVMKDDDTYRLGIGRSNANWKHDSQLYYTRKLQGWPK